MFTNDTLISVIIPTYNHGLFIEEAIQSVFLQTYQHLEIIVIDDGSTDNTREILGKFGKEINYIFQDNKGPSSARNHGLSVAKGKFIAFLDSDDVWMPEKLELQFNAIQEENSIGLVGCGGYDIDFSGRIEKVWIPKNYPSHIEFVQELSIRNTFAGSSSGAFAKKECFDRAGFFNERLRFGEDWDMWLRIAKCYKVRFVEKPLLKVRKHNFSKLYKNEKTMKSNIAEIIENNVSYHQQRMVKRKAYSYLYTDIARLWLSENRKLRSAIYLLRGLWCYPFRVSPDDNKILLFVHSVLPDFIYEKIKYLRSLLNHV
jgi:glycosyltransferase involved in cell wall biosynthesis